MNNATPPKNKVSDSKDTDNSGITHKQIADKVMSASNDWEREINNYFPVDAFPNELQRVINNLHNRLGFPVDFIGTAMLAVASTAIGNTYAIKVNDSWKDTAILFLAIVGSPGTAKTPVIELISSPLKEMDNNSYRVFKDGMKEHKQQPDVITKPSLQKFIVTDATPEALAQVHEINPHGLLMLHDELAAFFKNFNRYHGGSEQENWLSIWSGQPVMIDRKTTESIRIARPFISVFGGIQPGVLIRMADNGGEYNGWMDRFLFAYPTNLKKQPWKENTEDVGDYIAKWSNVINKLTSLDQLHDELDNLTPEVMEFTSEAWEKLREWQIENTSRINNEDEVIAGVLVKMEQYVIRLSLLLQLMSYGSGDGNLDAVGLESVKGAIELVTYFTHTAERVRNVINNVNPVEELSLDKKNLFKNLPNQFTTNEAVLIGEKMKKPEIFIKRFIADKKLFEKVKYGLYRKK